MSDKSYIKGRKPSYGTKFNTRDRSAVATPQNGAGQNGNRSADARMQGYKRHRGSHVPMGGGIPGLSIRETGGNVRGRGHSKGDRWKEY